MSDHNWPPSDNNIVKLANDLLERLHVSPHLKHWTEITSDVFVTLFEGLCGEPLPDAIRHPACKEDEIHNCQSVIDALSMDLLNTSLSHITGQDIVNKDRAAISNLLDVFAGLLEYIVDKISSDISRDGDSDVDPDLVTPEFIDSILEKELKKTAKNGTPTSESTKYNSARSHSTENQQWTTSSLGEYCERTSELMKSLNSQHNHQYNTVSSITPQHTSANRDTCRVTLESDVRFSKRHSGNLSTDKSSFETNLYCQAGREQQVTDDALTAGQKMMKTPTSKSSVLADVSVTSNIGSSTDKKLTATVTTQPATTNVSPSCSSGMQTGLSTGVTVSESILEKVKSKDQFDRNGIRKLTTTEKECNSHSTRGETCASEDLCLHDPCINHCLNKETTRSPLLFSDGVGSKPQTHLTSSLPLSAPVSHKSSYRKANSYENLENLVRDTVEISQAAVNSRKFNAKPLTILNVPSKRGSRSSSFRSSHCEREPDKSKKVSPNVTSVRMKESNGVLSEQSRQTNYAQKYLPKKNVSFATGPATFQHSGSEVGREVSREYLRKHKSRLTGAPSLMAAGQGHLRSENSQSLPTDKPRTIKEYLLKYYGRERVRSYSDGDSVSDSSERYNDESSYKSTVYGKRPIGKAKKMVKFDELLGDLVPSEYDNLRRKIRREGERTKIHTAYIDRMYEEDFNEHEDEVFDRLAEAKKKAKEVEKRYKQVLREPKKKSKGKYKVTASVLNKKRISRSGVVHGRKRSLSSSPTVGRRNVTIADTDIMPWLLEEFPYIHISPQTLHHMWNKSAHQIEQLSKVERDVKRRKSKAEIQIEEAERKQKILSDIMKKELKHNERLNEIKERRRQTQSVQAKIRERRLQSARCRKYYEEYHVRNRSRMLKKKSKEELIFRRLFEDALDIQKERIRELRKYAREQRNKKARQQQDHLESLENYYKDQYNILLETLAREREELEIRERAQTKVLNSLKRELQKKMEKEIREFQEQLYRDEDEAYFRQIDADRIKHQLNLAQYQAKI